LRIKATRSGCTRSPSAAAPDSFPSSPYAFLIFYSINEWMRYHRKIGENWHLLFGNGAENANIVLERLQSWELGNVHNKNGSCGRG
jgi:hypothetical protein